MDSTQSSFQDLDQAKFAAKMALAHKGMDIETLKKRQASIDNETSERRKEISNGETYIPTYITSEPSLGATEKNKKDKRKTIEEFDGDIWELAEEVTAKLLNKIWEVLKVNYNTT